MFSDWIREYYFTEGKGRADIIGSANEKFITEREGGGSYNFWWFCGSNSKILLIICLNYWILKIWRKTKIVCPSKFTDPGRGELYIRIYIRRRLNLTLILVLRTSMRKTKHLILCHKFRFSNPYIFSNLWRISLWCFKLWILLNWII